MPTSQMQSLTNKNLSTNGTPPYSSSYNSNTDEDFDPNSANDTSYSSSSDAESAQSVPHVTKDVAPPIKPPTPAAPLPDAPTQPFLKRKRGRPKRRLDEQVDKIPVSTVAIEGLVNTKDVKGVTGKTKKDKDEDIDIVEHGGALDSGDEVTIQERAQKLKKRKPFGKDRKAGGDGDGTSEEGSLDDYNDDEGGAGGWVKTRSQRRAEHVERKPIQTTQSSTVDVDAIWASIASAPIRRNDLTKTGEDTTTDHGIVIATSDEPSKELLETNEIGDSQHFNRSNDKDTNGHIVHRAHDAKENNTITIKRTYKFAGETTTETRIVAKDSAEARLYLASLKDEPQLNKSTSNNKDSTGINATNTNEPLKSVPDQNMPPLKPQRKYQRPHRRPSRFDPNPTGHVPALPEEASQLTWYDRYRAQTLMKALTNEKDANDSRPAAAVAAAAAKATTVALKAPAEPRKLTTITKSALDWAQHVDTVEGLRDELDRYGKGKEDYLGKVEFLREVEGRRYVDGRG